MRFLVLLLPFMLNGCVYYVYEQPPAKISQTEPPVPELKNSIEITPQSQSISLEAYPKDIHDPILNTEDNSVLLSPAESQPLNLQNNINSSPAGSYNNPIKYQQ